MGFWFDFNFESLFEHAFNEANKKKHFPANIQNSDWLLFVPLIYLKESVLIGPFRLTKVNTETATEPQYDFKTVSMFCWFPVWWPTQW